MAITKEMTIGEVVDGHPETVEVFTRHGMGCLGCPATAFENIEQGALIHGIDVEQLVTELNEAAGE
jgi:hybrid cluster-associated redox disulfide protein